MIVGSVRNLPDKKIQSTHRKRVLTPFSVRKDADDVATPIDLLVQPLKAISRGKLGPVRLGEGHVRQHVLLGVVAPYWGRTRISCW